MHQGEHTRCHTYLLATLAPILKISDYTINNSLSSHLEQAATACDKALNTMEPILSSLHDFPGIAAAGAVMTQTENTAEETGPPGPENPLWDILIAGGILVAGGAYIWGEEQQRQQVNSLWDEIQQWKITMSTLALQFEYKLPPTPTDPKPFAPTFSPLESIPLNAQTNEEIAQELYTAFGGTIPIEDIRDIIKNNPGLSPREYYLLILNFRRTGVKPYNVKKVVAIPGTKPGKVGTIFYITQRDIDHIMQKHGKEFAPLTEGQVVALIMALLQQRPASIEYNDADDSYLYYYDDVQVSKDVTLTQIAIAFSDSKNPGKVNTSFVPKKKR